MSEIQYVSLGWRQYKALEDLYSEGSPIHLEPLENYPGNIVDLKVIFFVTESDQETRVLTADGDLLTEHEYAKETT